ncbi:hypothetical protein Bca4012_084440 [Brassica carinata]
MLSSKYSYGLVYDLSVLKSCNILLMISNHHYSEIRIFGRFRAFFIKCVTAGNINAIYYEGIHQSMTAGLDAGIKVLRRNVPIHNESTLAVGVFNVCLGREIEASEAFQQLALNDVDLRSEEHFDMG